MSSDFVKVVPCAQIGGETYISSLSRMYPHIPLIAAGGVTQQNASKFILAGAIALGVGRELIPDEAIASVRPDRRAGPPLRKFCQEREGKHCAPAAAHPDDADSAPK